MGGGGHCLSPTSSRNPSINSVMFYLSGTKPLAPTLGRRWCRGQRPVHCSSLSCALGVKKFPTVLSLSSSSLLSSLPQPHLHDIVNRSMSLANTAQEPCNYFLLLRALFRSIGGGVCVRACVCACVHVYVCVCVWYVCACGVCVVPLCVYRKCSDVTVQSATASIDWSGVMTFSSPVSLSSQEAMNNSTRSSCPFFPIYSKVTVTLLLRFARAVLTSSTYLIPYKKKKLWDLIFVEVL